MRDMEQSYSSLVKILEDEIKAYRGLLDLVRREKELLIEAKIPDLEEINFAKLKSIDAIQEVDKQREKAARELAQEIGANAERPRLLEMAVLIPEPNSSRLRNLHATLDLLMRRLKELNKSNQILANAALKVVNGCLNEIKTTISPMKPIYNPKGSKTVPEGVGHFISREI